MKSVIGFLVIEDGAVVVDWMVVTAAVVGLAMAVMVSIAAGMEHTSAALSDDVVLATEQASDL